MSLECLSLLSRSGSAGGATTMPKKRKLTEQDVHAMIVKDAKMRLGCADFAPDFTIQLAARVRESVQGGGRPGTPQVRCCMAAVGLGLILSRSA